MSETEFPKEGRGEQVSNTKPNDEALIVLRTETALSRFPMHRIAKKSDGLAIEIHNHGAAIEWVVSHNSKYGQPGPLAYRIDTLLVNRRIEEAGKPIPRIIKLGSLPEIARELGFTGHNWELLRKALHQNASAYITAKINYRGADRTERYLEAGFNRYNVIFTGEKLPSGEVANAVYITLSDIFLDVLNTAQWRPLDYEYMKALPAGSQRFYEIVSYQVFGALKLGNPRAKFPYSEYCLLSTATRYPDFEHVKKQMYKIVRPHIQSGYLAKVEYEATLDEGGQPDWIMYLTPGINADKEYRAFTGQGLIRKPKKQVKSSETMSLPFPDASQNNDVRNVENAQKLVESLTIAGLNRTNALQFASEMPEICRRQLEYLPFVEKFKTSKGAYLRRAIEGDFGPPAAYIKAQEKQGQEQELKNKQSQDAIKVDEKKALSSHEERLRSAYLAFLCEWANSWEQTDHEAASAFKRYEDERREGLKNGPFAGGPLSSHALETFDQDVVRADRIADFCKNEGRKFRLNPLTFWEWDKTRNPEPFKS